jgi:hypothetical protein
MFAELTDRGAVPGQENIELLLDDDVNLDDAERRTMNRVIGVRSVSAFNSSI